MKNTIVALLLGLAAAAPAARGQDVTLQRYQLGPTQGADGTQLQDAEVPDDTPAAPARKRPVFNFTTSPQGEPDGKTSLMVFLEIPYANLTFMREKGADGYVARYEAVITLENDAIGKDAVLKGRWIAEVKAATYEDTRGNGKVRATLDTRRVLAIPTGETGLTFKVTDLNSKSKFVRSNLRYAARPMLPNTIRVSTPLLLAKNDTAKMEATPLLSSTYAIDHGEKKDLDYYLRVYNQTKADGAIIMSRIVAPADPAKASPDDAAPGDAPKTAPTDKVVWSETRKVAMKPGMNELLAKSAQALDDSYLGKSGTYRLQVTVVPTVQGEPVPGADTTQTAFVVNYLGLSADFKPEEAIDQLRWLKDFGDHFYEEKADAEAMRKKIGEVEKLGTEPCGKVIFKHRCPSKDPAKIAEREKAIADLINGMPAELRTVYFTRVAKANEYFSVGERPGWVTDRGMVYIVLGRMDERAVQKSQMVGDMGFEFWTYYKHPISGKPYIVGFYDRHGGERDFWLMNETDNVRVDLGNGLQDVPLCALPGVGQFCLSQRTWVNGDN